MRLVVDENLPGLDHLLSKEKVQVTRLAGQAINADALQQADALWVRSVTRVDEALLQNTPVGFVGTATIGVDHIDQPWLQSQGIEFASAPGCNAESVVDYVLAVLFYQAQQQGFRLWDQVVGIVGVGQVGHRLAQRLQAWGCQVLLNDPPREDAGATGLVSLQTLLAQADILCLHTPLTHDGPHPTHHLINHNCLEAFRGRLIINAGRGAVIDSAVIQDWCLQRPECAWVLDVFESEPALDPALISRLALATPHIAGYSLEGKLRGSDMIYQAWCRWQGRVPSAHWSECLPASTLQSVSVGLGMDAQDLAQRLISLVYPVWEDAWRLRQALQNQPPAQAYTQLRKHYPQRREFSSLKVSLMDHKLAQALQAIGFKVLITP